MNVATKLTIYGAGLAVTFVVAYLLGDFLVPDQLVDDWISEANRNTH